MTFPGDTQDPNRSEEKAAVYAVEGDWLVQRVDSCTCYGGRPYGHEPGCGWEPVAKVADMLEALGGQPHVALVELRKQRKAALDLCDGANMSDVWFAANIRAALGVCVACGCDLGTTPLCPSCEQSIEASKRERP